VKRVVVWTLFGVVITVGVVAVAALDPPAVAAQVATANSAPAPVLASRPPQALHILVIGATRGVGLRVTRLAAARGHKVRAMARNIASAPTTSGVAWLAGDVADAKSVAEAVAAIDVVVLTIGAAPGARQVTQFSTGTRHVLAALKDRPQVRVIVVTGIGAGDSRGHGGWAYDRLVLPALLGSIYSDKDRQEVLLHESPQDYVVVRPGFLTDDSASMPYRVVTQLGALRSGSVSRSQVAEFIVACAEQGLFARSTVLLTRVSADH
jgi:uncharacterized protein YbjT (DUF2867 family)